MAFDKNSAAAPLVSMSRLTPDQVDLLLCYLLRSPNTFSEAARPGSGKDRPFTLMPTDFNSGSELPHRLMWDLALQYRQKYGATIPSNVMFAELGAKVANFPNEFVPATIHAMQALWMVVYSVNPDNLPPNYGLEQLRMFVLERAVVDRMSLLWRNMSDGTIPADTPAILDQFHSQVQHVRGLASGRGVGVFDVAGTALRGNLTSTGYTFLDVPLGGGFTGGEVTLLYGATGSGKTRLFSMIASSVARRWSRHFLPISKKPPWVVFFTYESSPADIAHRILSCSARVPKDRLAITPWHEKLSSVQYGRPLLPYEYSREVQNGPDVEIKHDVKIPNLGEHERLLEAHPYLQNVHIFNHRGDREDATAGSGYIEEIASKLKRLSEESGAPIGLVFIDFLHLMVDKHLNARGKNDKDALRMELSRAGGLLSRQVATPFNCPVFCSEQLSGESNSRGPTVRQNPSDGMDCKTGHIEVDYTLQLGTKDKKNNLILLWTGKQRHSGGEQEEHTVLKYCSDFEAFYKADGWTVRGNQILDPKSAEMVGEGAKDKKNKQPPPRATPTARNDGVPGEQVME